jgi:hypothetical protein
MSAYFNIRNTLPESGTFLLGHPVYIMVNLNMDGCVSKIVAYLNYKRGSSLHSYHPALVLSQQHGNNTVALFAVLYDLFFN